MYDLLKDKQVDDSIEKLKFKEKYESGFTRKDKYRPVHKRIYEKAFVKDDYLEKKSEVLTGCCGGNHGLHKGEYVCFCCGMPYKKGE